MSEHSHISQITPLPSPKEVIDITGHQPETRATVVKYQQQIQKILTRKDPRLLLIVGPCSIHDFESGLEYARRLSKLARQVEDKILLVMRVYFEKPRTSVGWRGLIIDPNLDNKGNIKEGLQAARKFLNEVLKINLATATEFLDPITPSYISDLVCWSAIGARTCQSQIHRLLASALPTPVGFKNGTDGNIEHAVNALRAAQQPQHFLGINDSGQASAISSTGNPYCHIILRGGSNGSNYDPKSVSHTQSLLNAHNINTGIMIDCSHGNSGKNPSLQPKIFEQVINQSGNAKGTIIGAMIESNLSAGNQPFPQPREDLKYGVSITDPCIDWSTTEKIILEAYEKLRDSEKIPNQTLSYSTHN